MQKSCLRTNQRARAREGNAQTPNGAAMRVKPRNGTDKKRAWHASRGAGGKTRNRLKKGRPPRC
eukprot:247901-Alexandrium_andersonii.AAC.1